MNRVFGYHSCWVVLLTHVALAAVRLRRQRKANHRAPSGPVHALLPLRSGRMYREVHVGEDERNDGTLAERCSLVFEALAERGEALGEVVCEQRHA